MPTKKTARKSSRRLTSKSALDASIDSEVLSLPPQDTQPKRIPKSFIIGGALVIIALLLYLNRSMFLVAIVNGSPIFRWELNSVLVSRYGAQTLESIISEKLIEKAAADAGVSVTDAEVMAKEQELLASLGPDVSLDELLTYQGISKADFEKQLRIQLSVQKVLASDIVVSDTDVTNFVATASAQLTATDAASMREEARAMIMEQKVGERVQDWFTALKDNAAIERFLPNPSAL